MYLITFKSLVHNILSILYRRSHVENGELENSIEKITYSMAEPEMSNMVENMKEDKRWC